MIQLQHNVVNLLYTVKGMIETYLLECEEGRFHDPQVQVERAEQIIRKCYSQVDGAIRITRRLGSVLRVADKDSRYDAKACLRTCWQDACKLVAKEFRLDIVEIVERIPDDFPEVACDASELKEILYNLSKNAFQAIGIGGKLIVRAQIKVASDGKALAVVQMSDTGPGISGDRLSYLFKPFYSTKPTEQGNGLGLYLTKELVARNRGTIEVSSYEGCGATFTLQFPISMRPESVPA